MDVEAINYTIGNNNLEFARLGVCNWKMYIDGFANWWRISRNLNLSPSQFESIIKSFNGWIDNYFVFFNCINDIENFIVTLKLMKT